MVLAGRHHLAHIVNRVMHLLGVAFHFVLHHEDCIDNLVSNRDIKKHKLVIAWYNKDRICAEQMLDVGKSQLHLIGPDELVAFLQ